MCANFHVCPSFSLIPVFSVYKLRSRFNKISNFDSLQLIALYRQTCIFSILPRREIEHENYMKVKVNIACNFKSIHSFQSGSFRGVGKLVFIVKVNCIVTIVYLCYLLAHFWRTDATLLFNFMVIMCCTCLIYAGQLCVYSITCLLHFYYMYLIFASFYVCFTWYCYVTSWLLKQIKFWTYIEIIGL